MKILIQIVITVLIIAISTGCTSAYFIDRKRDAADIFTCTVGVGAGVQSRIGPLNAGIDIFHDITGLRGGRVVSYPFGGHGALESISYETTIYSIDNFNPNAFLNDHIERFKRFEAGGYSFIALVNTSRMSQEELAGSPTLHSYYTQIEITASILGGTRLGFNPGEFIDFVLGWSEIDIYNDDIGISDNKQDAPANR